MTGCFKKPGQPRGAESQPRPSDRHVEELPLGPGVLYPDLLPENTQGSNLSGILSNSDWDRLRISVHEASAMRCRVCGQVSSDPDPGKPRPPACHAQWRFELTATTTVQRLTAMVPLCVDCHQVQHIGRAKIFSELPQIVLQLRAVNAWSGTEIRAALANAGQRFSWRQE